MHPALCLRLGVFVGAIALAVLAVTFPPTVGTTIEPNEWFGKVTITHVGRAPRREAPGNIHGPQLFAELAFIGLSAGLMAASAGSRNDREQLSRACRRGAYVATAAMLCLPFGRGVQSQQIGIVEFFEEVWSSPLLWANAVALYVAWRKPGPRRSGVDKLLLGALLLAVGSWLLLFGALLLEDYSSLMRWIALRQINSGIVAACLAVLFAALAGTLHRAPTNSTSQHQA